MILYFIFIHIFYFDYNIRINLSCLTYYMYYKSSLDNRKEKNRDTTISLGLMFSLITI